MDEVHKERIAMNEATVRKINEGVRVEGGDTPITFLCECGRLGCNQLLQLSRAEYEAVRSDSRRFAIVPGHEVPDVEDIVERHERSAVIEKHADTEDIVRARDPRRPLED